MARVVTLERHGSGGYENGRYVHPPESSVEVLMSIQPLPGKEAEMLPEAERGRETMAAFSPCRLEVSSADFKIGDAIVDGDKRFRVIKVDNWFATAGYDRAVCVRLGQ
jgi:hypothetical protein